MSYIGSPPPHTGSHVPHCLKFHVLNYGLFSLFLQNRLIPVPHNFFGICKQQRRRPACASTQSDQRRLLLYLRHPIIAQFTFILEDNHILSQQSASNLYGNLRTFIHVQDTCSTESTLTLVVTSDRDPWWTWLTSRHTLLTQHRFNVESTPWRACLNRETLSKLMWSCLNRRPYYGRSCLLKLNNQCQSWSYCFESYRIQAIQIVSEHIESYNFVSVSYKASTPTVTRYHQVNLDTALSYRGCL